MTATTNPKAKRGLKILGLGTLACVGCCAGPVLAFLGGLSVAGLASATLIGSAGLLIAAAAAVAYAVVRKRRTLACNVTHPEPVPVSAPTRRGTNQTEEVPVP